LAIVDEFSSRVRSCLDAVIHAMKEGGAWDIGRPKDEAFVDMGAFGNRTMAFEQWLRWVFVPNVEQLLVSGGPWPKSSSVAVTAVREGDTKPVVAAMVAPLSHFDALFQAPEPAPVPPSTPSPEPSAARADEVARAILRGIMAMPEFARGRVLTLGNAAPVPPGDVPLAWIGSIVGGRPVVHALASDLGIFCSVDVLAKTQNGLILRSFQVRGADADAATRAVAEWLRSGGDADRATINPLDGAVMLRDALSLAVPALRGFRITAHTDPYRKDIPAMAGVLDDGVGVSMTARAEGGVCIQLAPEQKGAPRTELDVPSFDRFVEVRPEIVSSMKRALAARDAFLARPFTVGLAARTLVRALGAPGPAARQGEGARWETHVGRDDYVFGWPRAWIALHEESAERTVVRLDESAEGVRVSLEDGGPAPVVCSVHELDSELPALVSRVEKYLETLTADGLIEGRAYRVLVPMAGFEAGEPLRLIEKTYVPRESCQIYRFESVSRRGITGTLDDRSDADLAILRRLGLHLERID
jgi:uncharacterized protein YqcC (DUF446 family)